LAAALATACGRAPTRDVTWAADIAPFVHRECAACHRPGGIGPFALLSYTDVRSRAAAVLDAIEARRMPPWPADPAYRAFLRQRVVSAGEVELLRRWVASGMPAGDSAGITPPAQPTDSPLGPPDLVLELPEPIRLPGDGRDHFFTVKLPYTLPTDTVIRAIEFIPGNRALVHHMNGSLITYPEGAKADPGEGAWLTEMQEGRLEGLHGLHLENDDGSFAPIIVSVANYLPGGTPLVLPEGLGGWRVTRRGVFLMNMIHYGPTATPQEDRSRVHIYFGRRPPERPLSEFILGTLGRSLLVPPLVVPPDTVMTFRSSLRIPVDISVVNLNPHMHLLGRSFVAYALPPQGDTIPLVRIPRWDFRWQLFYTPTHPIRIPAGSVIRLEAVLDNTSANPLNPYRPPREIREQGGSMRTTDEMIQLIVVGFPYRPGDETIPLDVGAPADTVMP
jgi:hypothetical protein